MVGAVSAFRAGIHHKELQIIKADVKASKEADKRDKAISDIEKEEVNNAIKTQDSKVKVLEQISNVNTSDDARSLLNQLYS